MRVKTLHGSRVTHSIKVSILDKIEKIGEKLHELDPDELSQYNVLNLVYPMGKIRNLPLDQTVAS